MIIQHNLAAMAASRQLEINNKDRTRHARNLGSGYKINIAADNAAGLTISEKMRGQIRGLERSARNAQEGSNFIQVADGAMNEVHALLHRMRELSIQALNDTYVEEDRAAMAAEFDQLQSEIDKINDDTEYNSSGVFEDHEAAYYQVAGSRQWDAAQQHSIISPDNDLVIHLGSSHSPSDYTITVADGIYTTQELIDEIEDAFFSMTPSNPGLELEFTDDGYCNLNFESPDGTPVEIESVEGNLAYLIYDCYNGNTSASLLGTTAFQGDWPLSITSGQNDELSFYVENTDGSGSSQVSIKIPAGDYSRSQLITFLNNELATKAPGVIATEYGEQCIQITGGALKSITGLKGNMFKLETGSEKIYTSVFYDNSKYGQATNTAAVVTGRAYHNSSYTKAITIDDTNNKLRFRLNSSSPYTEIELTKGNYTVSALVSELNKKLTAAGADASFSSGNDYFAPSGGPYTRYDYFIMTGKPTGNASKIEFDTSNTVFKNTYDLLFCDTNLVYNQSPSISYGSNPNMKITGAAYLTGSIPITSGNNTLSLAVNQGGTKTNINITIPPKTYSSLSELKDALNNELTVAQKELIEFSTSGSQLVINGKKDDVTNISFNNTNGAYSQLFTRTGEIARYENKSDSGQEHYVQGSTAPDIMKPATITLSNSIPNANTTITSANNRLEFYLNGSRKYITLSNGTYSRKGLIDELNKKLQAQNLNLTASLTGNSLTLTTTLTGKTCTHSIQVNTQYSNGWSAFVGTSPTTYGPSMPSAGSPTIISGVNNFSSITLTDSNNALVLRHGGQDYPITLDKKKYTMDQLVAALQSAINKAIGTNNGKPKIKVDKYSSDLRLTAATDGYNSFSCSGNFYDNVIGKEVTNTASSTPDSKSGGHTFSEAYIVGREDLTAGPVEIVAGLNDKFILDFTHKNSADSTKDFFHTLEVTIPEGSHTGDELAALLQAELEKALADKGLDSDFEITAAIGGHNTGVVGSNDSKALQITVKEKAGSSTDSGTYILDGIRGSAAYFTFYKTSGKPEPSYITGPEDISDGVTFTATDNVLTLTSDGTDYSYTFPEGDYTSEEFTKLLNDLFAKGDDNGQTAPLEASVENGHLKISHKLYGNHTIENIAGTAKGVVFYREEKRDKLDAFMLQIGANSEQAIELPHLRISTAALGINSITISRPKYANKALARIDAAVEKLNDKRSLYGAYYNRLDHAISNNENTAENLQASESRIRDADLADEMVGYSKNNILVQAAQAMLAQANQTTDGILNLLQ